MFRIWSFIKRVFGVGSGGNYATPPSELPPFSMFPQFRLGKVEGATLMEGRMIFEALDMVNRVVKSPYFVDEVLRAKFTSTNGKSNAEILEDFTKRDIPVHISIADPTWKQRIFHTVGYDTDADDFVHVVRGMVTTPEDLGELIIHEVGHSLGYSHESAKEHTSVNYTMGGRPDCIFERVLKRIKGNNILP